MPTVKNYIVREVGWSFEQILSNWSLIDSIPMSAELSNDDARWLSEFLGTLLSDVVCRQLLPEAANSLKSAFGLNLTFEPTIQLRSKTNLPNSSARCGIVVTATAERMPGWKETARVFSSSFSQAELSFLDGDVKKEAFLKCTLLKSLFSYDCNDYYSADNTLHIFFCLQQSAPHVRLQNPELCVTLDLKTYENIESLLAGLLEDGYDLDALKPFLAA